MLPRCLNSPPAAPLLPCASAPSESRPIAAALIVIDAAVIDTAFSQNALATAIDQQAIVLILDRDQDGIVQISEALLHHGPVTQLHLFAGGEPGSLVLGDTELNLSTLSDYALHLMSWFLAYIDDPTRCTIALHRAEVGTGAIGAKFLQQLAEFTGATIAVYS